ncbi:hypothetical protein BDV93DRAFT_556927 [Ceratobasidium sp. AG-I]|nr:hypothetical protein BDV93DRAFT_556927 [Ceratobasidium sp. AG-I]
MAPHRQSAEPERRKARKQQRKEDMRTLQNQLREAQETGQRALEENEALRQQLDNQPGEPDRDADDGNHQLSKADVKFWKRVTKVAGRRLVVLHAPFVDPDSLADHEVQNSFEKIIDVTEKSKESDEELEEGDNAALYWDSPKFSIPGPVVVVWESIFHLSKVPGKFWLDEQFQDELHLGMRKQRSDIVHAVAQHYEKIFDISNPKFTQRAERSELPEVKKLLESFLHIGEEDEDETVALFGGASAIHNGHRSSKARKSHAQMWHIKAITPSLLAFAAVVIKFVLSGEETFEEVGKNENWTDWFSGRLKILEGVHDNNPDAYGDLIDYSAKSSYTPEHSGALWSERAHGATPCDPEHAGARDTSSRMLCITNESHLCAPEHLSFANEDARASRLASRALIHS